MAITDNMLTEKQGEVEESDGCKTISELYDQNVDTAATDKEQ